MNKLLTNEKMYDIANTHVRTWEQDYSELTNHPKDPGGPTKNGVSLKYLKGLGIDLGDLNRDGKIDIDDIRTVTEDVAKSLFRQSFWMEGKAALLPPLTSMIYYDFSVTSGFGRAAIELQRAIDVISPGTIVEYAGNIGPKTQRAVLKLSEEGKDYSLVMEYSNIRAKFYQRLATNDPNQYGAFIKGWLNRVKASVKMIDEINSVGITPALYENIRRKYGL